MVLAGVLNLCQTDSGRRVGAGLGGGGDSPNLSLFCSVVNISPTYLSASGAKGTQDLGETHPIFHILPVINFSPTYHFLPIIFREICVDRPMSERPQVPPICTTHLLGRPSCGPNCFAWLICLRQIGRFPPRIRLMPDITRHSV